MKVLLATDGSSNAIEAAHFLRRLQVDEAFELTILSVCYDAKSSNAEVLQPWFPEWLAQQQAEFEAHHAELESRLADRCSSITKQLCDGHPPSVILDEAKANACDLIVMGAQGHSAVGRVVLGSVSDSVATHATCSVLIVHPKAESESTTTGNPLSVAIAYDGSPAAKEALAELRGLNLPGTTPICLVSIAPVFDYTFGEGLAAIAVENEQAVTESLQRTVREVCGELRSTFPNVHGFVEKGRHIGDSIVATVQREKSEMLIIGDAGHGRIHDWILGSTSKFVLRHAPCSVWLSRHHRRSDTDE